MRPLYAPLGPGTPHRRTLKGMDDAHPEAEERDGLRDHARRLRWRMSGAWQLPTFALSTLAGAVTLHVLPIAADKTGLVGGFLLAGFANLVVMATLARPGGWLLRRRRPALPAAIAADRAAATLMTGLFALLVVGGILHHPAVVDAGRADDRQLAAARRYLTANGTDQYMRNIDHPSVWKQADFLYRTCFAGIDRRKNLCLIVDLSRKPPLVVPDPDQQPNSVVAGADNPGRHGQ